MSALTDATPAQRHRILADRFAALIDGVQDWDAPSPVKEWTAAGVVDHMGWLPGLLATWDVQLVIPEAQGRAERFAAQTAAVQALLDGPEADRVIDTQVFGVLPLAVVIDQFYNFDLFAHAWDLAKASGQDASLDADFAAGAYQGMSAMGPVLHESGQFGTPQPVADDASPQDKLIALIGRDPAWTG